MDESAQVLNFRQSVLVPLPRGDGTSAMRDPINRDWLYVTQMIIDRLEGKREKLSIDLLRRLGMNAVFSLMQDKEEKIDISIGVAQTFKMLLEEVFRLSPGRIRVVANTQRKSQTGPFACLLFSLGPRQLGLFFRPQDPQCEVFLEPSGDVPEQQSLQQQQQQQQTYPRAPVSGWSNPPSLPAPLPHTNNPILNNVLNQASATHPPTPQVGSLAPRPTIRNGDPVKLARFKQKFY